MKKKNKLLLYTLLFVTVLYSLSFCFAATDNSSNNFTQQQAAECLNNSRDIMNFMLGQGFNVLRINDSIKQAQLVFDSQLILISKKKAYDFSSVIDECTQIVTIRDSAISVRDQLGTLLKFYNESLNPNLNTSSADVLIAEINKEIKDERYENVPALIDKTYNEISAIQASQSTLSIFYSATTRGLKVFFSRNWKVIVFVVSLLIILLIIYRVKLSLWLLTRKIDKLKNKKVTIKELVMQTQLDYFQNGKIAEGEYNIKTKKYAELIRDIDRQVPLLQEELAKLQSYGKKG